MKMTYDAGSGTLAVRLTDATIDRSDPVRPGIAIDLDKDGRLVGFQIQDAKATLSEGADPFAMAEMEAQTDDMAAAAAHGSTS